MEVFSPLYQLWKYLFCELVVFFHDFDVEICKWLLNFSVFSLI